MLQVAKLTFGCSQTTIDKSTSDPLDSPSEAPNRERSRSISFSVDNHNEGDDNKPFIQDLCSFMEKLDANSPQSDNHLGLLGNNNKRYKLWTKLPETTVASASEGIISLEELLKPGHQCRLLRRERMQLAFRLSLAILQFCLTPWIDKSWTWKDFCALRGEEENDKFQLFVSRKFYSARVSANFEREQQGANTLWSYYDEPILTKLGFALIELALGRNLMDLRKDQPCNSELNLDFDSLNLQTAQALLKSGRIAGEESLGYEEVVKACLRHQYPDRQNSGVKGLDSTDPSFFDNVEESIIGPLYAECIKSWGLE